MAKRGRGKKGTGFGKLVLWSLGAAALVGGATWYLMKPKTTANGNANGKAAIGNETGQQQFRVDPSVLYQYQK